MQQAFYSYLPGARKELKKSNTFLGTIFKRKTINFQVLVGTTTFLLFSMPSTPSTAILLADFFKKSGKFAIKFKLFLPTHSP